MGAARQDAHSRDRAVHGHFAQRAVPAIGSKEPRTIKKYLREGIVEPAFQTLDRPSKLDPYAAQLTAWLVSDQRKSRKERRTAKLMHADLVKLGYDGSYEYPS